MHAFAKVQWLSVFSALVADLKETVVSKKRNKEGYSVTILVLAPVQTGRKDNGLWTCIHFVFL